jgi:ACR3 family arsenite efflux pump ArsB
MANGRFIASRFMVKIDFAEVIKAGKTPKPVTLTLFINWCVKPFTMFAIASLFLWGAGTVLSFLTSCRTKLYNYYNILFYSFREKLLWLRGNVK